MKTRLHVGLAATLALACGPAPEPGDREPRPAAGVMQPTQGMLDNAAEDFDEVRTGFLEWYMEAHPVRASELGVHAFDGRLPSLTRAGIQDRIDDLLEWLADVEQISFALMADENRYDYAVLEYGIRAELLELEESRVWANDPGLYTSIIARGLSAVAEREYAPVEQRAAALNNRMDAARRMLGAVRENVETPPRLWTEMAIDEARGLVDYVQQDLPELLARSDGDGAAAPDDLDEATALLVESLESHVDWLETDLLPRSTGTYRLGRYLLQRKLLYSEHVSLGLEELEQLNADAIAEYRARVAAVAEEVDPDRSPREIMDSINRLHPAPDELLGTARDMMATARDWVVESGVVPVPRAELPVVRESPPFARDAFSSLDAPGPFETEGLDAYYNLTNVRPDWDEELQQEHLTHFSYAALMPTTLHETFPGLYVQRQYERDLTDLRRVFRSRTFAAGWAHYAAGMAIEEGLTDDPAIRLGQYRRALERHARWHAVIQLHADDQSLDEVVAAFMDIAYASEFPARREVARATREPTYLADALGRMQILELRDDYREHLEEEDETYSLADFHQQLLRLGLPFTLAREVLIPEEPPARRRR